MEYSKPFLSVNDQVDLLESRGLIIEDRDSAIEFLDVVSYYRFSSYTMVFEMKDANSIRTHLFKKSSRFSDIVRIYEFDHILRLHSLKAIESIEVAFRTRLCYLMAAKHGSHWYEDKSLFIDQNKHSSFLVNLDRELFRSREVFITHYNGKYSAPKRPPSWMVIELLSIGTVSKLFTNISDRKVRKKVAGEFGLNETVLKNWIHTIVILRNFCAHHARVWNRQAYPLKVPKEFRGRMTTSYRYRDYIWAIKELLNSVHRDNSWLSELKTLLQNSSFIDKRAMGFRYFDETGSELEGNWLDDPVWN